ncbi:MAG: hypothetical protein HYX68_18275 [Planctomycetes bacterium]|jgi:hypothetical protein|nr:hypothetical protein [Planctomycetota bacterium]
MTEPTLEDLAKRVEALESRLGQREPATTKDWRAAAGMFTDSEFSRQVDEEALKIRQADRDAARAEFGE